MPYWQDIAFISLYLHLCLFNQNKNWTNELHVSKTITYFYTWKECDRFSLNDLWQQMGEKEVLKPWYDFLKNLDISFNNDNGTLLRRINTKESASRVQHIHANLYLGKVCLRRLQSHLPIAKFQVLYKGLFFFVTDDDLVLPAVWALDFDDPCSLFSCQQAIEAATQLGPLWKYY